MTFQEIHILLMVDDDPFDSTVRKSLLELYGIHYKISHVASFSDGLDCLRQQRPDVLLLDPRFGGGHSEKNVNRISATDPELPVILLVPGETGNTAELPARLGAQDYLVMGRIDAPLLHRSVRYAIAEKQRDMAFTRAHESLKAVIDAMDHPLMLIDGDSGHIILANARAGELFAGVLFSNSPPDGPSSTAPLPGVLVDLVNEVKSRHAVVSKYVNVTLAKGRRLRLVFFGCPIDITSATGSRVLLYCHDTLWFSRIKPNWPMLVKSVEQYPDAILVIDDDRTIRYANPAFETLFGWSASELSGKRANILVPVKQLPALEAMVRESLDTGEALTENIVCRKKDLSLFEVKCRISLIYDESGHASHILAVAWDVTGKQRLKSIAEASSLTENLGSIFSGIRHEIGNPLNSIKMALTVLNKNLANYPEDTIQEFIERSLKEVTRVESLLKEFKNFSLFETPSVQPNRIDVFLHRFIEDIRNQKPFKGIALHAPPVAAREEVWGYTDPQALEQVLLTITDNATDALEFTQHPEIRFRLTQGKGLVHLDIEDNGCGMTEAQLKDLFTPFNTSKINGTGLGLVMVKKMLARMDTTITIKSRPETGTCVTLSIPSEHMNHGY